MKLSIKISQRKLLKELVEENPEITREEIRDILSEEFDIEFPEDCKGMMHRQRCRCGPYGPRGDLSSEETE